MNKTEFITALADKVGSKKNAETALQAFQEIITDALINGDKITITGFVSFEAVDVAEKDARNPRTGETVVAPAHKKIRVKAMKSLKDAVNA